MLNVKMFLPGWSIWCLLLTLRMSAFGLEIAAYDKHEVICSQVLEDALLGHTEVDFLCCSTVHTAFVDILHL